MKALLRAAMPATWPYSDSGSIITQPRSRRARAVNELQAAQQQCSEEISSSHQTPALK
jgi:hypothetical protein